MHRIYLSLLAIFLSFPALAEETARPQSVRFGGLYDCSLSGLVFAKIGIQADESESHYTAAGDIAFSGAINLFVKHSSHTTVTGSGKNFDYSEVAYESHYKTNDKKRFVSLNYHNGAVNAETLVPPENRQKRPAVSQALKDSSVDPLSLLLKMRLMLIDALKNNESNYRINVYDGRRLTEVDFTVMGKRTLALNGQDVPAIVVMGRRKQIAGFTQSELSDHDSSEPPLYAYFTDDDKFWPVRLEAHMTFGTLAVTLTHQCEAGESCLLGNSE